MTPQVEWQPDGSFAITGGEHCRILGWAKDIGTLTTILTRLDINAYATAPSGSPDDRRPTFPPPGWQYPFDFTADIELLTTNHPHLEAVLEHLDRIRNDIPESEEGLNSWITHRARQLQEHSPQVDAVEAFAGDHALEDAGDTSGARGLAEYCEWIDPRLIVSTPDKVWNQFNRRPEVVPAIVRAARDANTDAARRNWVRSMFVLDNPPDIVRVEGPAGPIYSLGSGGSHRSHAARILDLPYMVAEVHLTELPYPTTPDAVLRQPMDTMERVWRQLTKRKVLSAKVINDDIIGPVWIPESVTAEWMLLKPNLATRTNRSYEQLYPGALTKLTGLPVDQLVDAQSWLTALSAPTRWERLADLLRRRH